MSDPPEILPVISSISPDSAGFGDTVIIRGSGFDFIRGGSIVTFNSVQPQFGSDYLSWSDSLIKVKVPWTTSGKVYVEVDENKSNGVNFIIKPIIHLPIEYGIVKDVDSNTYKTVKIGSQWWMAENLNVSHYRNGDIIPQVTDYHQWDKWDTITSGAWYYLNNDTVIGAIYGKLYNAYAVLDKRGIAPEGWHIPTDAEWSILTSYLGGESVAGGKLKESDTTHWQSPNYGATNETGFTALPGSIISYRGDWWTCTEYDTSYTFYWARSLYCYTNIIDRFYSYKKSGFSVRCVKD
ncbi:MAG: FISUMP domain-containing protein [Bacteroidota bacterium]